MSEQATSNPLPPLVTVDELKRWLPEIFPEGTAHRNYVVREMAAKTIYVMLYTGAVEGMNRWFRPAQATLMTNAQAHTTDSEARLVWAQESLMAGRIKHSKKSWYAPNSREPIRDETLRSGLIPLGAVVERSGVPTTASLPRYALSRSFCDLLAALHAGEAEERIVRWQETHLSAEAIARIKLLKTGAAAGVRGGRVSVKFPNGETRLMLSGPSTILTKAVIETFAPRFLAQPAVLLVSDSGEKIVARDEQLASHLGLHIQTERNLPDIILVDIASGRERLVFVEVVATDGAITPQRKQALGRIAFEAKFSERSVFFVTAFLDRSSSAFRKLAPELAWDTFAWFSSEPEHLISYQFNAQLNVSKLEQEQ